MSGQKEAPIFSARSEAIRKCLSVNKFKTSHYNLDDVACVIRQHEEMTSWFLIRTSALVPDFDFVISCFGRVHFNAAQKVLLRLSAMLESVCPNVVLKYGNAIKLLVCDEAETFKLMWTAGDAIYCELFCLNYDLERAPDRSFFKQGER